jgi:hypothetical protein
VKLRPLIIVQGNTTSAVGEIPVLCINCDSGWSYVRKCIQAINFLRAGCKSVQFVLTAPASSNTGKKRIWDDTCNAIRDLIDQIRVGGNSSTPFVILKKSQIIEPQWESSQSPAKIGGVRRYRRIARCHSNTTSPVINLKSQPRLDLNFKSGAVSFFICMRRLFNGFFRRLDSRLG